MHRVRATSAAVAAAAALALSGCASAEAPGASTSASPSASSPSPASSSVSPTPSTTASPSPSASASTRSALRASSATLLVRRLEVPWGVAFLPSGAALVGERRSGDVLLVSATGRATRVGRVADVDDRGEGGLLGLAVDPDDTTRVYAYLTSTHDDNRVVTLRLTGTTLRADRTLLTGIPAGGRHNGGRIVVGPDGRLWIGTGDAGETVARAASQRPGREDPADRPRTAEPAPATRSAPPCGPTATATCRGWRSTTTGRLWATEFGQDTYDELNLIRRAATTAGRWSRAAASDSRFDRPAGRLADRRGLAQRSAYLDGHARSGRSRASGCGGRRSPATGRARR